MTKKHCFVVTDAISFNVLYRDQLEYLKKNGLELTLICGGKPSELNLLRQRDVGKVIDLHFVREPKPWLDLLCLIRLFLHFIFNRYDVVVTSTPKALLVGSIASFLSLQPRRVSFFRGRVYENFTGGKRKAYILLDKLVIACSQKVIFVSKSLMAEFIKDIPSAETKGGVVGEGSGNGVCSEKFSPNAVSSERLITLRDSLGIKNTDVVILAIGRICQDKGLKELIEVATLVSEKTPDVRFIMLGSVEDHVTFQKSFTLQDRGVVIHVDFVADIVPYLALADIHLFLSHREGFGNVAIEAASMCVPTFAFDVVGVRDSVAEGVSGLRFKRGDSESVSEAILNFVSNPEAMQEKFKDSRAWAIKNFSKDKVWKNYKNFYLGINQ